MGGGTFIPTQGDPWQFFSNAQAEPVDPDNALGTEGEAPTLDKSTIYRLRVQIVESGATNGSGAWTVQYDKNDNNWVAFGAGNDVNWANGAATEGGTCPPLAVYLLTGSNSTGQYIETSTYSSSVTKSKTNEFDLAFTINSGATAGQRYRIRILQIGSTSVGAPTTYAQFDTASGSSVRTPADNVGVTDAVSRKLDTSRPKADNVGVTDATFRRLTKPMGQANNMGVTDAIAYTLTGAQQYTFNKGDNVGVTDSAVRKMTIVRGVAEG